MAGLSIDVLMQSQHLSFSKSCLCFHPAMICEPGSSKSFRQSSSFGWNPSLDTFYITLTLDHYFYSLDPRPSLLLGSNLI